MRGLKLLATANASGLEPSQVCTLRLDGSHGVSRLREQLLDQSAVVHELERPAGVRMQRLRVIDSHLCI